MNQYISELIEKINEKTILKLNRKVVQDFEIISKNKIRIFYLNGKIEDFGNEYDCVSILGMKYNLKLKINIKMKSQFIHQNEIEKFNGSSLDTVIDIINRTLLSAQRSKTTTYTNIEEIKVVLYTNKKDLLLCKQSELLSAFAYLYKESYEEDKDMFIYFDAINKEIKNIFKR